MGVFRFVVEPLGEQAMRRLSVILVLLLPCMGQLPQPQPIPAPVGGNVIGTLTGDDGTLIGGAVVGLTVVPPYPAGRLQQTQWTTVSGADGSFQFGQLPTGNYRVCSQSPGTAWLNPCEWGSQPPPLSLTPGEPSATVAIVLNKGAVVPIRLSDPSGFLSQYEGKVPAAQLLIGVSNDASFFRTALIVSTDATGRSLQVVIPFGVTVNLIVCSSFFQLSNAAGILLPANSASIPITVQPGQQPSLVTLVVTAAGQP
jgi:hypothetical protein